MERGGPVHFRGAVKAELQRTRRNGEKMEIGKRYRGCLIGLAAGDALGAAVEFKAPGELSAGYGDGRAAGRIGCSRGCGPTTLPWRCALPRAWSRSRGSIRSISSSATSRWMQEGYLSSNGRCFDIGGTRRRLLRLYRTRQPDLRAVDPDKAGNGSIMRLAPVPMFFAHDPAGRSKWRRDSSRTTHGAPTAVDACRYFAALITGPLRGAPKKKCCRNIIARSRAIGKSHPLAPEIAEIASGSFRRKEPPQIRGTGYVVQSLEAALWAFYKTDNFREGCLLAVNLGDDADTTAAVYGQLAGAYYGEDGIPESWRKSWRCGI